MQSTLVLSRIDDTIIKANGFLAAGLEGQDDGAVIEQASESFQDDGDASDTVKASGMMNKKTSMSAKDVARAVFSFISAAEGLGSSIDNEDDVKLMRMRTRKHEIVIVPGNMIINEGLPHYLFITDMTIIDAKFLLVAIYEAPRV